MTGPGRSLSFPTPTIHYRPPLRVLVPVSCRIFFIFIIATIARLATSRSWAREYSNRAYFFPIATLITGTVIASFSASRSARAHFA